jgi:bifunctional non-homologous end joining protein LigD
MQLATRTILPRVTPIIPTARPNAFNDPAWLFEPKYDGFRGMVYLTGGKCTIYNKRGTAFSKFDDLRRRLCAELPRLEVILDGEIIAIDDQGRMDFWGLMKGRGYLAYAAFDLLWLKGKDLRQLPLIDRKKRLKRLLPETVGPLNVILWFEEDGRELFQAARQYDVSSSVGPRYPNRVIRSALTSRYFLPRPRLGVGLSRILAAYADANGAVAC